VWLFIVDLEVVLQYRDLEEVDLDHLLVWLFVDLQYVEVVPPQCGEVDLLQGGLLPDWDFLEDHLYEVEVDLLVIGDMLFYSTKQRRTRENEVDPAKDLHLLNEPVLVLLQEIEVSAQ
jgi:hypothetical protein